MNSSRMTISVELSQLSLRVPSPLSTALFHSYHPLMIPSISFAQLGHIVELRILHSNTWNHFIKRDLWETLILCYHCNGCLGKKLPKRTTLKSQLTSYSFRFYCTRQHDSRNLHNLELLVRTHISSVPPYLAHHRHISSTEIARVAFHSIPNYHSSSNRAKLQIMRTVWKAKSNKKKSSWSSSKDKEDTLKKKNRSRSVRKPTPLDMERAEQIAYSAAINGRNIMMMGLHIDPSRPQTDQKPQQQQQQQMEQQRQPTNEQQQQRQEEKQQTTNHQRQLFDNTREGPQQKRLKNMPSQHLQKQRRPSISRPTLERQCSTQWLVQPSMLQKQKAVREGLLSNHLTDVTPDEFLSNFNDSFDEFLSSAYRISHDVELYQYSNTTLHTSLPEDVFALIQAQLSLLHEYVTANETAEKAAAAVSAASALDSGKKDYQDQSSSSSSLVIIRTAVSCILSNLMEKQRTYRHLFLQTFESCLAASNDFMKMSQLLDDVLDQQILLSLSDHSNRSNPLLLLGQGEIIRQLGNDASQQFVQDAVYATERAVMFVVRCLQDSDIPNQLFNHEWEDLYVHNQIMVSIVDTVDDFLTDIRTYVNDEYLCDKAIIGCLRSAVCFYVQCFVNKANKLRLLLKNKGIMMMSKVGVIGWGGSRKKQRKVYETSFLNPKRAVIRMKYDIQVLHDYFESIISSDTPDKSTISISSRSFGGSGNNAAVLRKAIEKELSVFVVLWECMELAANHQQQMMQQKQQQSKSSNNCLEELVIVVHKRTGGNLHVTQNLLLDLWLLFGSHQQHHHHSLGMKHHHHHHHLVETTISNIHNDLDLITFGLQAVNGWVDQESNNLVEKNRYSLDDMLKHFYQDRDASLYCGAGSLVQDARNAITTNITDNAKHTKELLWEFLFPGHDGGVGERCYGGGDDGAKHSYAEF